MTPAGSRTARTVPNRNDVKAEEMKTRICRAVVEVIDREGYAETSLGRVQETAGVSRGAMTHHFPTKQDLVCETAMRLLDAAMTPIFSRLEGRRRQDQRPIERSLRESWNNIVNTREGRAIVEILVACRTDQALHEAMKEKLYEWDRASSEAVQLLYRGSGPEADDAAVLWSICRTFLRGLLIHRQFVADPAYLTRMFDRFSTIMTDHMFLKEDADRNEVPQ